MKRNRLQGSRRRSTIKIMAVGDIMLGTSSIHALADENNLANDIVREPKACVHDIREILHNADFRFGNLECLISKQYDNYPQKEKPLMVAPLEALDVLTEGKFDIVNLANNHILDHGIGLAKETIDSISSKNIKYVGAPAVLDGATYTLCTVGSKKFGFLGFNLCRDGEYTQPSIICDSITRVRKDADYVVLSLHWGDGFEHMPHPSPEQIQMAHRFVNHGTDIIIGHHTHVLQPVEIYQGKIIAYSLGNFIFDMWREQNREGAILEIRIDSDTGAIRPVLIPTNIAQNRVFFDTRRCDKVQSLITNAVIGGISETQYRAVAKQVKRQYNMEIILYYIKNFYRIPLAVHKATLLRWAQKAVVQSRKNGERG